MSILLSINVHGTPAPQGSKRHVGNGIMVESSAKRVKPWREAVKAAALAERPSGGFPQSHSITADIVFRLPRPKGHYRTGRNAHMLRDSAPTRPGTRPDIDKLIRSTLDALKDAGAYKDDGQVVNLYAGKYYALPGETLGAHISLQEVP